MPRAGRYLVPGDTPYRGELIAACAVLGVLAHLLFAQLTLLLVIAFQLITRASRWRPQWLAAPAAVGLLWALAEGPGRAASGFGAGPSRVVRYFAGAGQHPGRILHFTAAYAGLGQWLPRQLPLALVLASAEVAVAAWLTWLRTDEWKLPGYRPGVASWVRRSYLARVIAAGGVVTRDGACLGLDAVSGRRATLSWAEVAGGVLCAGAPGSGTTTTSFQLVHAAIRRRKPVIAVSLDDSPALAALVGAVCAATQTPLHVFPPGGPGYYDPLRSGEPARRTSLVMGMADWGHTPDPHRRSCAAYLTDLFAVLDAAPGDPATPVLDEIVHLLSPAALRARMGQVPAWHPRCQALTDRVRVSAAQLENEPRAAALLAGQLGELRASALGRWLTPDGGPRVDLGRVVRERAVVLLRPAAAGDARSAVTLARLIAHDVLAVCTELRRIGVPGDGLVWFDECGALPTAVLAELITRGASAGLPALLTMTDATRAQALAGPPSVLALHRMADPAVAARFAACTGEKFAPAGPGDLAPAAVALGAAEMSAVGAAAAAQPSSGRPAVTLPQLGPYGLVRRPVVSAPSLSRLGTGEHVLVVRSPQPRVVPLALTVPARAARGPAAPQATAALPAQAQLSTHKGRLT